MLPCLTRDTWTPWQSQLRAILKWKSTGPRRDSGNIIGLPQMLDHFQMQHPLSSSYVAKSLKGGPHVIWSCLANFLSKTLLKSISSFYTPNSTALVQSFTSLSGLTQDLLNWSNSCLPISSTLNLPLNTFPHCSQSDLPKTQPWLYSFPNFEWFWTHSLIHSFHSFNKSPMFHWEDNSK